MNNWHPIEGGVTAPQGFVAAGIQAGLKPSGAPDLALIVSEVPAIAAGVFTTSTVRAACVDYDRQVLASGAKVRGILCNAGQANACTGAEGWRNTVETAESLQKALATTDGVLVASTGVIGKQLAMDKIRRGITTIVPQLSPQGGAQAAAAIVTTDLVTKFLSLETTIQGCTVRMGGMAKGSGMIHPTMATMLGFVTCDALVEASLWQAMTREAADRSFNQITVDGDTSTNDMLLALCNGQSGLPLVTDPLSPEAQKLSAMLTEICIYLAKSIARDGEGATCLLEVQVRGARSDSDARQLARTVASSALVKSALFGRDPNWGRIAAAAGRSGVNFDSQHLKIQMGDFLLMEHGQPLPFDRAAASGYLKEQSLRSGEPHNQSIEHPVVLQVTIGDGEGLGTAWGCDLSYDYVKINAEYTT